MGRTPSGRPTSFDIAYRAGVSQPTVSRALRGDKSVSAQTRARIEAIAAELNYTVDKNASSLRSQRSNTIALLFFEDPTPDESMINPFFLAMLGSITRACADRGLDLLISFQKMEDDWHVRYQDSHRADGLILLGYGDYTQYRERMEQLGRQGTHFARAQSMIVMIAWAMLFGALADGAFAWITIGPPQIEATPTYIGGVFYLGVVASAVTFPLYFGVIRAVGPGQAAWSSVLIPIIAMGFSTALEGYHWAPLSIAGGAVALVGLVIAVAKRPAKPSVSGNMVSLPVERD